MQGFGAVEPEADEPVFHHAWERTVFGAAFACFGQFPGGTFRHAIERMDPGHYLRSSYYEHWLSGLETLAVESGLLRLDDLRRRGAEPMLSRPVSATARPPTIPIDGPPRHAAGDVVRVRAMHPSGHTRCPGYIRGRTGTVVALFGRVNLDDVTAHGGQRVSEPVYLVRFTGRELWGDEAEAGHEVHVEVWESYLE